MAKVKNKNIPPRADVLAVADRLHSTAIHLLRRVRKQDSNTGIGPAQLSALSVLIFGGPKTLGQLASAEQVKPPTMSRIVEGLRRAHLIHIDRNCQDARRISISPTPKGVRLLHEGRQRRIEYLAAHLHAVTTEELGQLASATTILERLLGNWL